MLTSTCVPLLSFPTLHTKIVHIHFHQDLGGVDLDVNTDPLLSASSYP